MTNAEIISSGNACLGIEFGSTRIKAVLINDKFEPIANGSFTWENSLIDGIWTYNIEEIHKGLQTCYADLKKDVKEKYNVTLSSFKCAGISAMMHGYLAFDKDDNLLVPFRTWRNTITGPASELLSTLFNFPVPERWSVSHFYQAILNNEEHISKIANVYTLAAYIHYKLTGEKVIGVGDASGMFPVEFSADKKSCDYKKDFVSKFEALESVKKFGFKIKEVFPKVLMAGENAGKLTEDGAKFLDPEGDLKAGILMCPPEGDAGTGMVATNSVEAQTGNISAGTSVFSMVVLEKDLKKAYPGIIDIVTTPDGYPVAMVHCNNCTGEHNYWMNFFKEIVDTMCGSENSPKIGEFYDKLIMKSLEADEDCGNLLAYNYLSGETITGFNSGRPLFVRGENAQFNIANFMRVQMFSSLGALRVGMDILYDDEKVPVKSMTGAGGYFKTEAGLKYMACAMKTPVSAMETAGEGGPWGMAILAAYATDVQKKSLSDYLNQNVFAECKKETSQPDEKISKSFEVFYERYKKGLAVEKAAVESL
ncbi:MAG: FGGY-family carbohydrate kinase [Treponema sp.]|nr:FGGY-family carbohydrate kinase [Spirochaetales bacterium]MDY6189620.1 FGGY-family carbohydrate kinase [Treponema sp.]